MIRSHHFSAILDCSEAIADYTAADFLQLLHSAAIQSGLLPVAKLSHTFEPQGISAIVLLAESHIALHAWTELGKVTVDIHVCDYQQDNHQKAQHLAQQLTQSITGRGDRATWHYSLITD